tara:strand:- start:27521 stop:27760 length:240 start_codon:yes stop_codon:yes gene_type:complete
MLIKIKVFPGAKKEKFHQIGPYQFEAYIKEPAQRNLANIRMRELVAHHFGVPVSDVVIKAGHRARIKTVDMIYRGIIKR